MIDQYLNINSIDPQYWGKSGWIFLNSIALTYKPEAKANYKLFIQQLPYILPCRSCGDNLKQNMISLDDALQSKEDLLKWLLKIRNSISEEHGRPLKTLTDNTNEIFTAHNTSMYNMILTTGLSFIVLIILVLLFKKQIIK
jgi:hypothetical protein